ncbi:MAG TPA: DinB family protein [Acidisarcina sp.]
MTVLTERNVATPVDSIYLTNDGFFSRALEGLSEDELWYQPTENSNPMLWIAGHTAQARVLVLKLMSESHETGWNGLFDRGNSLKSRDQYPPVEEVARAMRETGEKLHVRLQSMTDEELLQPATGPTFPNAKTLIDQIAFLGLHESYHVGQMAYVRKALGHGQLVG